MVGTWNIGYDGMDIHEERMRMIRWRKVWIMKV